jgi:ubiquinone/menaquinone biosynthesis C-methylase UbiE
MRRTGLALFAVAVLAAAAAAQQRDPEEYAKTLEGAERVSRLQVPRVIADLQLKPSERVADIGSGSGLFTRPMARAVAPGGVAYAVDIDQGLLGIVARRAREQHIGNIKTIAGTPDDPRLPERVDLVLICDTLHHIGNRRAYLAGLKRYLKPSARVAIIDYGTQWPQGHESMKYDLRELREWMSSAGYRQIAQHDYLPNAFYVIWVNGPA